ncbi:alpha/beta-hydrolase [Thelephora ganbajun]|uniref:Alpha/beta-hydrolase n=1 Tax=Thelephora ganbajun TaxID=370292 RepID=A0ACB6Z056_THEGA|nr:alpha/beta-hydrolase [Thelephora ganbajun]
MASLFLRQPFKAAYLLGFFTVLVFIRLPYWLVYYSWRSNRPRKSWTLHRTINVQILRKVTRLPFQLGITDKRDLSLEVPQKKLESLNARFVWIPELEKRDLVGMVAEYAARAAVKSIAIPAYWILKEGTKWSPAYEKAQEDEKVILYFHGGGFLTGTAYPSHPTASLSKGLLKYSTSLSRVLSVDYRLSSGPPFGSENPFPSAVIDAVAAYRYLVCEAGFLPQNITVAGDSAGGNLALASVRYIVESRLPHLPPPGGLIASSPWTDMSYSHLETNSSHFLNSGSDIFDLPPNTHPLAVGENAINAYIGEMDRGETKYNRYLSPASKFVILPDVDGDNKLFSGFPRSYIIGGGAEHLFDDIVVLAEKMKDDGVDTTTDFPPDAVHDYPIFDWHEPERTESFIKCAAWLDERWATVAIAEQARG